MPTDASSFARDGEAERWNYRPEKPITVNPLFSRPPRPAAVFSWYSRAWLPVTFLTLAIVMTVAVYFAFLPPLAEMKIFQLDWIFRIWLLNVIPQSVIAGGLHW